MKYKIPYFAFTLYVLVFILMNGCALSYPTEEAMIDAIKRMCKDEYKVDVKVDISGATLSVSLPVEGLFDLKTMKIAPEVFEKANINGVMLSATRVALSGNKNIDFYTVVAEDKDVPGAEIAITRHIKDLRRFVYRDISRGEFTKRIMIEFRLNPQASINRLSNKFTAVEVKLHDFISRQAEKRIVDEFQINTDLIGKFTISECTARLENQNFIFDVDIAREGLPMSELIHGKAWHENVLLLSAKIITHLIWAYSFEDFDKVLIKNKFDNNILKFSKEEIDTYRKKKINIE